MSTNFVKLYYGPTDTFHTLGYKPQKLNGLRDRLRKLGYRVDIQPIDVINCCVIEMCGHVVFRCNINYLAFNTPCELDPVCTRAVDAVLDATTAFNRARVYLWSWTILDDLMFKRSEYAPKDYWPFLVNIKPFTMECINCCGILVRKKTEDELRECEKQEC